MNWNEALMCTGGQAFTCKLFTDRWLTERQAIFTHDYLLRLVSPFPALSHVTRLPLVPSQGNRVDSVTAFQLREALMLIPDLHISLLAVCVLDDVWQVT